MSQQQQNQLELPPVSFARYFELLKRRRWQVLPMSLVGLVVGAVVALLIPRYYVADTTLSYQGTSLDEVSRTEQDPLFTKVKNANLAFPALVPQTLEELNRIPTDESDPARQEGIDDARTRLDVRAYEVGRNRGYYNIEIIYRDTEGQFAADFCNTMRELFVDSVRGELEAEAQIELARANEEVRGLSGARDYARQALQSFLNQHKIIDGFDPDSRGKVENTLLSQINVLEGEVSLLEAEIGGLTRRISKLDEIIQDMPPDKEVEQPVTEDAELRKQLAPVLLRLEKVEASLQGAKTSHPSYDYWLRERKYLLEQIAKVAPDIGTGGMRIKIEPNKDRLAKIEERNALDVEAAGKQTEFDYKSTRLARLRSQFDQLGSVYATYQELRSDYEDRDREYTEANTELRALEATYRRTRTGNPLVTIKPAQVPPVPTEPNALFVAVTGCIVGLGAAIGLVLLLDFLRSSFKTVEDVAYALKVPVLGSMAYLETTEDRIRNVRHRRNVSLVAASFVIVSLSLVTVYYVAPTRLPTAVLHALDTLLGATTAR